MNKQICKTAENQTLDNTELVLKKCKNSKCKTNKPVRALGYCSKCETNFRRYEDPNYIKPVSLSSPLKIPGGPIITSRTEKEKIRSTINEIKNMVICGHINEEQIESKVCDLIPSDKRYIYKPIIANFQKKKYYEDYILPLLRADRQIYEQLEKYEEINKMVDALIKNNGKLTINHHVNPPLNPDIGGCCDKNLLDLIGINYKKWGVNMGAYTHFVFQFFFTHTNNEILDKCEILNIDTLNGTKYDNAYRLGIHYKQYLSLFG